MIESTLRKRSTAPVMTVPDRACPTCRAREATQLCVQHYKLFDDSSLPRETAIVRCATCGLAYSSSRAGPSAYRAHYARHSKYDTGTAPSGSGIAVEDRERLRETAVFLGERWDRSARILDIGAGRGGLLRAMANQGFVSLEGIDPSAGCVSAMRADGLLAGHGLIEDEIWPTDPRPFDAIVLSHVLEHVYDVGAALSRIGDRLTPGGNIYVEVPDASRYDAFPFPPAYFFDPEHINHFDLASLDTLAASRGWSIAESWSRELVLSGAKRYPAIGVVLRRGVMGTRRKPERGVERYAESNRVRLAGNPGIDHVAALAESGTTFIVWGAGSHAQRLLAEPALTHARIDCIIDSDPGKQGRSLDGHRVVTADEGLVRAAAIGATLLLAIAVDPQPVLEFVRDRVTDLTVVTL